jgi:flagellar FliL protein
MNSLILSLMKQFILTLLLVATLPAVAAEHGGGAAAAGPEPMQFTVNVGNSVATMRFMQVTIVLDFAKPEVAHRIAEIKPKVLHRIILLLSSEEAERLQTTNGKKDLQERIAKELNELIDETPKSGVTDVYFTSFIIQ